MDAAWAAMFANEKVNAVRGLSGAGACGWPGSAPLDAEERFRRSTGDTLIYGDLAKNLLLHGQYAITDGSGVLHSTLIRLPGYPLFLALCFRLFGMENYYRRRLRADCA